MGFRYSRKIIKIIRFSFTLLSARTHVFKSARRTRTGIYPQNTAQKYCFFLIYARKMQLLEAKFWKYEKKAVSLQQILKLLVFGN